MQLFDTAAGGVRPFVHEPGKVSMYVCGPTVYGPPHLGHGRFALVFDILRRYLELDNDVTYVSNITDIDDKIVARAAEEGRTHDEVAHEWEAEWFRVMDALNVKRPTRTPHATEYVEGMIALIADLMARGAAYETPDGIYFAAETVGDYGLLARQPLDSLRAGARVEVGHKRSPVDFALWKFTGEPSWPSPWGPGRPGWHTECVVMSVDLLGPRFDLHGGGQDLAFPHHENERAQAAAMGHAFAAHWVHNGFVEVGGEKMSKSLGNYQHLADVPPRAYRMLVLQAHYRSPVEVTPATVAQANEALARIDALVARSQIGADSGDAALWDEFRAAMDDDLDTPRVMAAVFGAVRAANAALDAGDTARGASLSAAVARICDTLGLARAEVATIPAEHAALAAARDEARAAKDFARSDALRDELAGLGYVVEDTPDGTRLRPRATA